MLICELRKLGRHGSLFANFTPDTGSRYTSDRSPEPFWWPGSTSVVWNWISQKRSKPITCSSHRATAPRVGKFEVVWSKPTNPRRFAPPRGRSCISNPG